MKSEGFHLYLRDVTGLIETLMDVLAGAASLSLEGDLSLVEDAIAAIPGASAKETSTLRRNTISPQQDFIVLPIEAGTISPIKQSVIRQAGIGGRVCHVQIAKSGTLQFGAYDLDGFNPARVAFAGDAAPESFLNEMVSRGLLRGFERVPDSERR
jgi:hypothetical protein